ncbi:hypothetical protein SCHPADRAFT_300784 [Schizopora paradoxa]|uniref:DUF6533 domain-containing protein n=1 Tax=Schizopora paradoxa TaxID=27342 RepID=A0A0H2RSS1_9AGAM|nr:hypothetical protein SCHPADRAFT_300784 [Schizopora paradoxa]
MLGTLDLDAFRHARLVRCYQLAATVLLVYEYLLTFSDEIELFWKKRWSFGKCIFLWSRYYSLFFNIGNAFVFLQEHPSRHFCDKFFHWQNTGAGLQVITTHIILELRLYAMYQSSRWILVLFVCMTMLEAAVMGVFVGFPIAGLQGTNRPSPGLHICADGDPPHRHWVAYYWTCLLTIESVLLSLSCYKAFIYYRRGTGGNIMRALTRDSLLYYLFIFGIYLGNQIIWLHNDITLNELGTGFSFCISAILANRLMLSVRSMYFNGESQTSTITLETRHVYSSATPGFLSLPSTLRTDVESGCRGTSARGPALTDDFDMTVFEEERGF